MKKIKFITLIIISIFTLSCSDNSNLEKSSSINNENGIIEKVNFTYNNQTFTVSFKKDEKSGELTPIQDDSFQLFNEINNKNASLITYYLNDENFILFKNDEDLSVYLKNISLTKNKSLSKNSSSNILSPYDNPYSLNIYNDSNYNKEITWYSNYPPTGSGPTPTGCYYKYGTNSERLKNFADTSMWKIYQGSLVVLCGSNEFIGNKPNDRVSSIKVAGCYARFYEDINYGGKSFVLDARFSGPKLITNLKDLRFSTFHTWNDEISSISLSN
tara:strand:+ start:1150 stop:1965 length:816 start_codon:yes stop_codon:yes gene_type:complete